MGISEKLMRGIGAEVREYVARQVAPLTARIASLERELVDVRKTSVRYLGVYQRMIDYKARDAVTHDGTLWCCTRDDPQGRPGASAEWQMMHKTHAGRAAQRG